MDCDPNSAGECVFCLRWFYGLDRWTRMCARCRQLNRLHRCVSCGFYFHSTARRRPTRRGFLCHRCIELPPALLPPQE